MPNTPSATLQPKPTMLLQLEILEPIVLFIERGGDVLLVLLGVIFVMWGFILERLLYLWWGLPRRMQAIVLDFAGDIYGMKLDEKKTRIDEFLKALSLEGREGDMISAYSEGMKQKVIIISAIMHKPELLIMDEPITSLDPKSARIVKDLLRRLASQGVTTIMSTHVLEIAQAMCDRIAIMHDGKLLALGTMDELRRMAKLPASGLEDVFLKLTGTGDVKPIVEALLR